MNLIVEWTLLIFVMNVFSCSSVPVHIRNMSSMSLFYRSTYGCPSHARIGSNDPMNSLAYAGTILVPMAVPCSWRKKSLLNSKTLFLRTMFSISSRTRLVAVEDMDLGPV